MKLLKFLFISIAFINVILDAKAFKLKKNTLSTNKFKVINIKYYEMQLAFSLLIFFLILILSLIISFDYISLYSLLCAFSNLICLYLLEKLALKYGYISLN